MYSCVFLILAASSLVFSEETGFYWRDYFGEIPKDAIIGRKDSNNRKIYIGQTFVKGAGLMPAEIHPGEKSVHAPYGGVKIRNNFIKILCGKQENFYWMETKQDKMISATRDKKPVIGGHEKKTNLFVGRSKSAKPDNTRIGKIMNDGRFYYVYGQNELRERNLYEILLYKS